MSLRVEEHSAETRWNRHLKCNGAEGCELTGDITTLFEINHKSAICFSVKKMKIA